MTTKEKISHKIFSLLKNYQEAGQIADNFELNNEQELYGRQGIINSFNLVTLVVDIEEFIENEFGKTITIADEKVFSLKHSPFKTIGTLAEYSAGLLEKNG